MAQFVVWTAACRRRCAYLCSAHAHVGRTPTRLHPSDRPGLGDLLGRATAELLDRPLGCGSKLLLSLRKQVARLAELSAERLLRRDRGVVPAHGTCDDLFAPPLAPVQGLVALAGDPGNDPVALAVGVGGALCGLSDDPLGAWPPGRGLSTSQLGVGKLRLGLLQPAPCLAQLPAETPEVGGEFANAVLATVMNRANITGRLSRLVDGDGTGRRLTAERRTLARVAFSEVPISLRYPGP